MADQNPSDALLDVLAGLGESNKFCSHGELPIVIPGLEVAGLGPIGVPIAASDAKRLIKHSDQAPYGLGEDTIVDTKVRRVWQIGAESLTLSNPQWQDFLTDIVDQIADDFAIKQTIKADLYKLLIYEKGSFFKAHRDTEKTPGMFATLVIVLPSTHTGGELIITNAGQTVRLRFDRKESQFNAQFAAFYADCEHEVIPVKSGYRICLVYNLSIPKQKQQPLAPTDSNSLPKVQELLTQIFAAEDREKIAIPLTHQYSKEGLSLGVLKGVDRTLVDIVTQASKNADFEGYLAALEIHQSGAPDFTTICYTSSRSRRYSYYDDDADIDPESEANAEFDEIFDEDRSLECLVNINGDALLIGELSLDNSELLAASSLDDWPHEQSVREATGNEGASMDRWYRRTCLVLWPKSRAYAVLAKEGPHTAIPVLKDLIDRTLEPRQSAECINFATSVLKHWSKSLYRGDWGTRTPSKAANTTVFAKLLTKLGNADLLDKFITNILPDECSGDEGSYLVTALDAVGWNSQRSALRRVLDLQRDDPKRSHRSIVPYIILLEQLCCSYPATHADRVDVCRELASVLLELIIERDAADARSWRAAKLNQSYLVPTYINIFAAIDDRDGLNRVIQHVLDNAVVYPLQIGLIPEICKLYQEKPSAAKKLQTYAREQLRPHVITELQKLIGNKPQAPTDFTRDANVKCRPACSDCVQLNKFLANATEETLSIGRNVSARKHLSEQIQSFKCDVTVETIKTRSPHFLLCTKTDATYQKALSAYNSNLEQLKVLEALS